MDYRYDTYCGLYCGACPFLQGTRESKLEQLVEETKMPVEDMRCGGCKSAVTAVFCRDCEIKHCAEAKKLDFCGDCADYPCKTLTDFRQDKYPHHSVVFTNLRRIKEAGTNVWLEEQEKRWSCRQCGRTFNWYDEKCTSCGAELYDCRKEEKDIKD